MPETGGGHMSENVKALFGIARQIAALEDKLVAAGAEGPALPDDPNWIKGVAAAWNGVSIATPRPSQPWIEERWARIAKSLTEFGWKPNLSDEECFTRTLERYGEDFIRRLEALNLGVIYLPGNKRLSRGTTNEKLPGYQKPLNGFYWDSLEGGQLLLPKGDSFGPTKTAQPGRKNGLVIVVDTRCKPSYTDGSQMWVDDKFLGQTIEGLRKADKIPTMNWCPRDSRFGVSAIEYETVVAAALNADERFEGRINWVGGELACQWNVICQIYKEFPRASDGTTDTWIILRERFVGESYCLVGGRSGVGGLANVDHGHAGNRWRSSSGRPLGVLERA